MIFCGDDLFSHTKSVNKWAVLLPQIIIPAGNSSLPSTSQELAEIFGTSDDEEDVDFPFSISSGLPGELSLQNPGTKKFDNSLLGNSDSEMFLTHTFHDALSSMPPVPVSINQSLRVMDMQVDMKEGGRGGTGSNDKPKDEASTGKGEELMETKAANGNEREDEQSGTEVRNGMGRIDLFHVTSHVEGCTVPHLRCAPCTPAWL